MLRSYQSIMLGEVNGITSKFTSLASSEKAVLLIICAAIIVFGVYPKPLLDISEPAVINLIEMIKK
jgi:NADH-quinone oxidoreductase subunit M